MGTPVDLKQPRHVRWCTASIRYGLLLLAGILVAGCGVNTVLFVPSHRATYDMEEKDLRELQFYISTEVIAHPDEKQASGGNVLILPADTPGLVTEVGPNWLRVAFQPGSRGAVFLDTSGYHYELATEVAERSGFHRLKDLSEKVLLHEGRKYQIIRGADARLWVDQKDLKKLIKQRQHIEGLKR